ncbi:L-2-amino-thiazoline-4-carboxylic acid hydrolase [Isosphaeraceae bacterium EP7]
MADEALTLLKQREIEAKIVAPLIQAVREEIGEERALALLGRVIERLALDAGADLARQFGQTSLEAFSACLGRWSQGGALEIRMIEQSPDRLDFDVTRCRYAEMYKALGLEKLGPSLSCVRDYTLAEGFNPDIRLTRTQTIMEGADHCDFRFRANSGEPPSS